MVESASENSIRKGGRGGGKKLSAIYYEQKVFLFEIAITGNRRMPLTVTVLFILAT